MRRLLLAVAAAVVWAAGPSVPVSAVSSLSARLMPGDLAPPFTLKGSDGRVYSLAGYRGKQAVVLAWFAKAFTSG